MKKKIIQIVTTAAVFFGVVFIILIIMTLSLENKMIYYPIQYPEGFWEPGNFGITVEDVIFKSVDGVNLHGWYAEGKGDNGNLTLLWFHGNAGNITHRLENMRDLIELGVNIFIFDYRGYGKSEGSPDEAGIYKDGIAAYDYLINVRDMTKEDIILFGRSLGTAVAVEVASHRPVRGMILETSFTDAKSMARIIMPYIPIGAVMSSRFDSIGKIRGITVPILFTHGDRDSIIPIELGRELFDAANEPKYFYTIRGADHNDTYIVGGAEYYARIKEYLDLLQQTENS